MLLTHLLPVPSPQHDSDANSTEGCKGNFVRCSPSFSHLGALSRIFLLLNGLGFMGPHNEGGGKGALRELNIGNGSFDF
jgi:hypothetical protein